MRAAPTGAAARRRTRGTTRRRGTTRAGSARPADGTAHRGARHVASHRTGLRRVTPVREDGPVAARRLQIHELDGDVHVLHLAGDLDLAGAPVLARRIDA